MDSSSQRMPGAHPRRGLLHVHGFGFGRHAHRRFQGNRLAGSQRLPAVVVDGQIARLFRRQRDGGRNVLPVLQFPPKDRLPAPYWLDVVHRRPGGQLRRLHRGHVPGFAVHPDRQFLPVPGGPGFIGWRRPPGRKPVSKSSQPFPRFVVGLLVDPPLQRLVPVVPVEEVPRTGHLEDGGHVVAHDRPASGVPEETRPLVRRHRLFVPRPGIEVEVVILVLDGLLHRANEQPPADAPALEARGDVQQLEVEGLAVVLVVYQGTVAADPIPFGPDVDRGVFLLFEPVPDVPRRRGHAAVPGAGPFAVAFVPHLGNRGGVPHGVDQPQIGLFRHRHLLTISLPSFTISSGPAMFRPPRRPGGGTALSWGIAPASFTS